MPGYSSVNALHTIWAPIALNLAGYVVGTLLLSPISDRIARPQHAADNDDADGNRLSLKRAGTRVHQLRPGSDRHRHGRGGRSIDRQRLCR
jgi:hypothetical protein